MGLGTLAAFPSVCGVHLDFELSASPLVPGGSCVCEKRKLLTMMRQCYWVGSGIKKNESGFKGSVVNYQ